MKEKEYSFKMAAVIIGVAGGLPAWLTSGSFMYGLIFGVIIGLGGAWLYRRYIEKQKVEASQQSGSSQETIAASEEHPTEKQ